MGDRLMTQAYSDPKLFPKRKPTWYRNFRGKFHLAEPNWVWTGHAVCGADVSKPARYWWPDGEFPSVNLCAKCAKKVETN